MIRSSIIRTIPRITPTLRPTPSLITTRYLSSTSPIHIIKQPTRLQSLAIENIRRNVLLQGKQATSWGNQKRGMANEQTVNSPSVGKAAQAEARAVVKDLADIISGGGARENVHVHASVQDDFLSITKGLVQEVPRPVLNFGLAGTIPYIGTSVATVFLAREVGIASTGEVGITGLDAQTALAALHTMEHIQITYGAVILSFLGALHWGMEFSKYGGEFGYQRLAVGTVPLLLAWPTTFLSHGVALAVQWASFTGVWMLDQRAATNGWTPIWYSTYRFYLSLIVGFSIIFTLAGTSYYGAGSGAATTFIPGKADAKPLKSSSAMQRIGRVAVKDDPSLAGKRTGKVEGTEVVLEDLDEEGGDAYVKIHHPDKDHAEEEKEEKEKEEIAHDQDTKEIHQSATSPQGMKSELKGRTDMRDGTADK